MKNSRAAGYRRRNRRIEKKQPDYVIIGILCQFVICATILLVVYFSKLFNPISTLIIGDEFSKVLGKEGYAMPSKPITDYINERVRYFISFFVKDYPGAVESSAEYPGNAEEAESETTEYEF